MDYKIYNNRLGIPETLQRSDGLSIPIDVGNRDYISFVKAWKEDTAPVVNVTGDTLMYDRESVVLTKASDASLEAAVALEAIIQEELPSV